MRASASGVSRTLAIGGRRPIGSNVQRGAREGIYVRRAGAGSSALAYVSASYDHGSEARAAIEDAVEILVAAGYNVAHLDEFLLAVSV